VASVRQRETPWITTDMSSSVHASVLSIGGSLRQASDITSSLSIKSDDVEDIGRPDLEVLRASEAKNCDLLIEIGGRMDKVCESCNKVF
jgi:hypothetical protein